MLVAILFGIFAGFFLRGVYNKYMISKVELILFKDFVYLKEKKSMMMHKMGIEENEIKIVRNIDNANIEKWQHTAINKFLLAMPPRFKGHIEYRTWKGAMTYLQKFIKKA